MAVITLSREYGSEGSIIAERAAKALGYHLADRNTLEQILTDYGLMEFEEVYASIPSFWDRFDAQRMERRSVVIDMLNKAIEALAHHGNTVIVGRGGFAVLAGLADVLHVRVQAPLPLRVRRITADPAFAEPSKAELAIKESDRIQKAFVKSVYDGDLELSRGFDLVIDTSKISLETATDWVVESAKRLVVPDMTGVRTAAKLEVDRILAAAVTDVYKCEMAHA